MALPNDRLGDGILKERRHDEITQGKFEYPIECHFSVVDTNEFCIFQVQCLLEERTQLNLPPTVSQSEGHDDSDASNFDVQINVTPEDHSPRATRSYTKTTILQDTPPQSEDGGSSSVCIATSRSKSNDGSDSLSTDNSGCSAEFESSSQEDANSSPPAINTEVGTGVREEVDTTDDDVEITDDDTMVMYVTTHEPDPAVDCLLPLHVDCESVRKILQQGYCDQEW
uniref:Integrase core domain containing protein n=1 Tax=Solanum tuberosum TaxID=4113 RepID=M1DAA9_SOLTU